MSAEIKGFVVTLEPGVSEEGAEKLRRAILMIKAVTDVDLLEDHYEGRMARNRIREEIRESFYELWKHTFSNF